MNKKFTGAFIVGTTLLLTSHTSVFAQDFTNHSLKSGILKALDKNIISLDYKDNFYPDREITRAEFASIISKALNLKEVSQNQFADVPKTHPYYDDISKAIKAGIIVGYNNSEFKPDKPISREEMAVMMFRYIQKTGLKLPVEKQPAFKDSSTFQYPDTIQAIRNYKIVAGYGDNTYRGKSSITRAESTAIAVRLVDKIDQITAQSIETVQYFVQDKNGELVYFTNYTDAYNYFKNKTIDASLSRGNQVIDMNTGVARTKEYTLVYQDGLSGSFTYVAANTELKVTKVVGSKVYVKIGDKDLYVNATDVTLIPLSENQKTSYYINQGGLLYHKLYANGTYSSYNVGKAPNYMEENVAYRSFEGNRIGGLDSYQYFNYLPLRTPTSYTGAQLDAYIRAYSPNSPLIGYGHTFVDAANRYKINPMYLLANAIHESAWGTSKIAQEKKNLFGFKAYDSDAYGSAASFSTLEEGIYYCAQYISDRYLTTTSWAYQGAILGNKSVGMNVKYASDPYWGQKIAGHMSRMDALLGNQELNKYLIGTVTKDAPLYTLRNGEKVLIGKAGDNKIMAKKDTVQTPTGLVIRLFSDDTTYDYVYVSPTDFKEIKTY